MLAINTSNFIAVTENINRRQKELLPAEKEAYPALRDFWRFNTYSPDVSKNLLAKMTKSNSKRPASDFAVILQDFRRLCFDYYTKDKTVFEAFQNSLSKSSGQPIQLKPQQPQYSQQKPLQQTRPQYYQQPQAKQQPFQQPKPQQQQQPQQQSQLIPKTIGINQIIYTDGSHFTGTVKNNQPNGMGKFIYANGNWEEGFFKNGKLYGNGKSYDRSLQRLATGFFDGDILKGKILYKWANGDIFKGHAEINANKLTHGTFFIKEKGAEAGTFINGKWFKGRNELQKFANLFWKFIWLIPFLICLYNLIIRYLQGDIESGVGWGMISLIVSGMLMPVVWELRNWVTTFSYEKKRNFVGTIGMIIFFIVLIDIIIINIKNID